MKTYGSVTGTARQVKKFYGSAGHQAKLITKVYGPVSLPDSFNTLTIQSGGIGNITGTNAATFTTHIKSAEPDFWGKIALGEYIPVRIESTRYVSLIRTLKLFLIYRLPGSSTDTTYTLLSNSSDSSFKTGLSAYGFSYASSFSNGTDVINFTMNNVPKTKLIYSNCFL